MLNNWQVLVCFNDNSEVEGIVYCLECSHTVFEASCSEVDAVLFR